ncbi:MAG TPA: hypothetical protein VM846_13965 [Vicinamibacterales bacterium]|nr:hypothetical protein [Vicinamibacterales bacterium]
MLLTRLRPITLQRLGLAAGIAVLAGAWTAYMRLSYPASPSDLDIILLGTKAWLAGNNPYTTVIVGPPGEQIPLMYPFPAMLLFVPFIAIPAPWVDVLWTVAGSGFLVWALTSERLLSPPLAMFIATPFILAIQASQWTPQLLAATLLPWGGWLFACKPTTALWLFAYRPTWRHVITGGIAVLISLAFWPTWPLEWRAVLGRVTVAAPVTVFGGALALLALLRWRRPEARLLVTMAVVPHSPIIYEALPLFLVPATWAEAGILWAGTVAAVILHDAFGPYPTAAAWLASSGRAIVWCVYLPALIMILRRPNVFPGPPLAEPASPVSLSRRSESEAP